jgi:hypothetical protein
MSKKERIAELELLTQSLRSRLITLENDGAAKRLAILEARPFAAADLEQRLKTLGEMEQRLRKLEVRFLGSSPERAEQAANPAGDAALHALRDTNSDEVEKVYHLFSIGYLQTGGEDDYLKRARALIQCFLTVRRGRV